jgi:pentatricopeptide repeat protein
MDTAFETFFYQRDYSIKNFNFYLQVLAQQYKADMALETLRKMETLGIKPND